MPKIIGRYASINSNESTSQASLNDSNDQTFISELNERSKDYVFRIIINENMKAVLKLEQFGNKFVENFRNPCKPTIIDSTNNSIQFSPKQW